jgi:hypothetical protein
MNKDYELVGVGAIEIQVILLCFAYAWAHSALFPVHWKQKESTQTLLFDIVLETESLTSSMP